MHDRATSARSFAGSLGAAAAGSGRLSPAWRALADVLVAERSRWLLWVPVLLAVGIATAFAQPALPPLRTGVGALASAGVIVAGASALLRRNPARLAVALAAALLLGGFGLAVLRTHAATAPVLERPGMQQVIARVVTAEQTDKGQRLLLADPRRTDGTTLGLPTRLRINLRHADGFVPGDLISVRARLQPPMGPALPGGFDYARQAFFEGLGAVGYGLGRAVLVEPSPPGGLIDVAAMRSRTTARLAELAPGDAGAIAAALLTGARAGITDEVWRDFQVSGLAHILSISGLHMVLVAGAVMGLIRYALALIEPLALRVPVRKVAALVAILVAGFYMLLAGATVPTQRSFVMIAIGLMAVIVDRDPISMRLLAWAALVVLVIRPESVLGASFQLSFAAVTALIAVYEAPAVRERLRSLRADSPSIRAASYLGGVTATTVIAGLATAPFGAFHFQTVPTYGVLANLFAVPVTSFWIMPAGLATLVLMPLGLDGWSMPVMASGIAVLLWIAHAAAALPGAAVTVGLMPTTALVLVGFGGLWLALWLRPWRWAGLVPLAVGVGLALLHRPPDLLVAADLQMAAARLDDGRVALVEWRGDRLRRDSWLKGLGVSEPHVEVGVRAAAVGGFACDPAGCVLQRPDMSVALVRRADALAEDCRRATLVVADVGRCDPPTRFIDWRAARASQGMALYFGEDRVDVRTVRDSRGAWPWVPAQ